MIYITDSNMLQKEELKNFLMSGSRKERKLMVFYLEGETISFPVHQMLVRASAKMQIDYREIGTEDEFLVALGMMIGENGAKEGYQTILGSYSIPAAVTEKYNIHPYIAESGRRGTLKTAEEQPENADAVPKAESIMGDDIEEQRETISRLKEGADKGLFLRYLGLTPEEIGFEGGADEMALAVAEAMVDSRTSEKGLSGVMKERFGEEGGQLICEHLLEQMEVMSNFLQF